METLELLTQPHRERLADQIARQIKRLIFSKKVQVGEKLPTERELAESLQVSRVVVREALRSLEQSGFVEIQTGPNGGSFVSDKIYMPLFHSIHDLLQDGDLSLQHFYEARKGVELTSIQLAAREAGEGDLTALERINEQLLGDMEDNERFPYHNMEFHVKISEMSGNPLVKLLAGALLSILILLYPEPTQSAAFIRTTYERHRDIIEALRAGDQGLCEKLICEDVEMTKEMLDS